MIDINTIKEGDVVVCRNGGKLSYDDFVIAEGLHHQDGTLTSRGEHPFDIVDIIRKPEPKVEILYIGRGAFSWVMDDTEFTRANYKMTITDGVPSIEVVNE